MADIITQISTADGGYVDDYVLSSAPTKIKGQADSRSPLTIVIRDEDGNVVETREMTARAKGKFTFEPSAELPDGDYTIEITALQDGVEVTETTAIKVDTVTEAPVIESVTPYVQDGNELRNFAGTAEPNATVTLFAAGAMIGTAQADENGRWELPVEATNLELTDITVEATDLAGNTESSVLEDDTEAPIFEGGQTFTYEENRSEGDVLVNVVASDNVGIVSYAIVGGDGQGWFEIDNTGAIRLTDDGLAAAANDFGNGADSFTLTIRVTDASGNVTEQDVTLTVSETQETFDDIRAEIFEDSSSDGERGNNNGVLVTAEQLSQIADDVYKFTDSDGNAVLEREMQWRIINEYHFSETPTDDEIQTIIDRSNSDFKYLFAYQQDFNEDYVRDWDVSDVKYMNYTFMLAKSFNQDITGWNLGGAISMKGMFGFAKGFNQDIGVWDVSNVESMFGMFLSLEADSERNSFDQDIGGWDISSLKDADRMLEHNINFSTENFDKLLAGWGTLDTAAGETNINMNVALGADELTYTDVTSKNHLENVYGWNVKNSTLAETDSAGRTIFAGDNSGSVIDLSGAAVAQAIHALDGDDTIIASAFDDLIVGGAGDDVMTGGGGADAYVFRDYGGEQGDFGHDTITDFEAGAGAGDVIRLELTGLTNFADLLTKATDTENGVLIQIDDDNSILLEGRTIGDLHEDDFEFVATDSKTFTLGSYGDDTLTGDDYNNRIDGRSGDDTLTGGAGEDVFVFKDGYGNDTISDFSVEDQIEIDAGLAADYQSLESLMSEITDATGTHTVIDFGNGDTLTLENVATNALTADEFSFL